MTRFSSRWPLLVAALGITALAACSTPPAEKNPAPAQGWPTFLSQYQWKLASATAQGERPLPGFPAPGAATALQARFGSDARLGISGGCNQMGGGYQISDAGQLTVSPMVSTRRACVGDLMALDAAVGQWLAQPITLSTHAAEASAPTLTMRAPDGSVLTWAGQLTNEARYGSATIVFYEVAPERRACSHPLIPNMRCLQVRELRYDANGLMAGPPGEWQNLYSQIEGYSHTEGMRQVLRIKRYQRPQPLPADASSTVLVLDMIVSSSVTPK